MRKEQDRERARAIEETIRLAWESLESHLPYTHSGKIVRGESYDFHKKCVQDYAKIISLLTKLY